MNLQNTSRQRRRTTCSRHRSRRQRRQGAARFAAAAVEFAICANILIMMILACIEFARMNMVRNLAQDAAYFAARHAIVPGATSAEARAQADAVMQTLVSNGYTVDVNALDSEADQVEVTVTVDLTQVALFAPYFLPNAEIETTAVMRTERYDHFFEQ